MIRIIYQRALTTKLLKDRDLEGCPLCSFTYVLFSVTHLLQKKQNASKLQLFIYIYVYIFFQAIFSEWKPCIVFPRIVVAITILFWRLWVRKLFKGDNYSKEEPILISFFLDGIHNLNCCHTMYVNCKGH